MSGFAEYTEYDGIGLAELIRTRQVTPDEVLEAAISRIEALNPALNAVVTRVYDEARAAIPNEGADGSLDAPFVGVPFLLKDLGGAQAGVPMSAGSRFFEHAPNGWPCWAFSNHDVERHVSRWAPYCADPSALARQAAAMLLTFRGSVCLYQGEELGLPETDMLFEELTDPPGMDWKCVFKPEGKTTKVEIEVTFATEDDLKKIVEMGFKEGFAAAHTNLDELLAKQEHL